MRSDGTPYKGFYNRQVMVQVIHEGDGPTRQFDEKVIIPSDSVVRYEVRPRSFDRLIRITVSSTLGMTDIDLFMLIAITTTCTCVY